MEECVVDLLCLLHEWPDTIDVFIVKWLMVKGCLAYGIVVENIVMNNVVHLIFFINSLVDEDLVSELFDFNIETVVGFVGGHQSSSNHISGEDVSFVLLNQLNHDGIIEKCFFKCLSIECGQGLLLTAVCLIPSSVILLDITTLLLGSNKGWSSAHDSVKDLFVELLNEIPFRLDVDCIVSEVTLEMSGLVTEIIVLLSLLLFTNGLLVLLLMSWNSTNVLVSSISPVVLLILLIWLEFLLLLVGSSLGILNSGEAIIFILLDHFLIFIVCLLLVLKSSRCSRFLVFFHLVHVLVHVSLVFFTSLDCSTDEITDFVNLIFNIVWLEQLSIISLPALEVLQLHL